MAQGAWSPEDALDRCAFCGDRKHECWTLIAGPDLMICDGCVATCLEVVDDARMLACAPETDAGSERVVPLPEGAGRGPPPTAAADSGPAGGAPPALAGRSLFDTCAFCGERKGGGRQIVAWYPPEGLPVDPVICHDCLDLCRNVLVQQGVLATPPDRWFRYLRGSGFGTFTPHAARGLLDEPELRDRLLAEAATRFVAPDAGETDPLVMDVRRREAAVVALVGALAARTMSVNLADARELAEALLTKV